MIPGELTALPQWIAWEYRTRGNRRTKVPLSPLGGLASSTDPATWSTYPEALSVLGSEGVGFVFAPDDPYVGVDLDACVNANGRIHDAAHAIVSSLAGYVEFSPSATGMHVIVRGSLERGRHTLRTEWGNELALYDRGRFFTMSGDGRGTIRDAQPELDDLIARYFTDEQAAKPPVARSQPISDDDAVLLDRMFTGPGGDRIRALYEGDTSGHGDDHSAADLALCAHLAFYTGQDASRVDALFRRSGLWRPKWDEKRGESTYGRMTIEKAMGGG